MVGSIRINDAPTQLFPGETLLPVAKRQIRRRLGSRIIAVAIVLATLSIVGGIMFYVYSADLTPRVYQSVFHLSITIGNPNNNQNMSVMIPGGIGVQPAYWNYHALDQYGINGRAPIYTLEDNSGIVRIQSNNFYNYTLGDFFQIWGRSLNSTCINVGQWYCSNSQTGMFLGFFVNGQQRSDYENHIILYQDIIKIDYQQIG